MNINHQKEYISYMKINTGDRMTFRKNCFVCFVLHLDLAYHGQSHLSLSQIYYQQVGQFGQKEWHRKTYKWDSEYPSTFLDVVIATATTLILVPCQSPFFSTSSHLKINNCWRCARWHNERRRRDLHQQPTTAKWTWTIRYIECF